MNEPHLTPLRAAVAATALLCLGFAVGYGFHTSQSANRISSTRPAPKPTDTPTSTLANSALPNSTSTPKPFAPIPPTTKGLRVSPDGKRVAFTGVYGDGVRAARFVLDLQSGAVDVRETPRGWQDFVVQWNRDSRKILFDREKIPRGVAEATAGLHEERFEYSNDKIMAQTPRNLTPKGVLPRGEKSFSGLWTPDGELVVKTRREPKSLFQIKNGRAVLLDRANGSYLQNRVVRENGRDVLYVVRELSNSPDSALFRVANGRARQIGETLRDVEWTYVADSARWMIVCRTSPNSRNWLWTLYRVSSTRATRSSTRSVPGDVISVFWSPDERAILGASGESLWTVSVPSLNTKRIGVKRDWEADDAGWIPQQNAVVVASRGTLWRVDVTSGQARALWKYPARFWKQADKIS